MNVSNVTRPYHYTEPTDDPVTLNLSVTPSVTLTPVTYDIGDLHDRNREATTSTHGEYSSSYQDDPE